MARKSRKPGREPLAPPPPAPWRAGGYCRLSAEDEEHPERHSLENQRSLILDALAGREDIVLQDFYLDNGRSGTTLDRPGFQRLLADLQSGIINCMVVKDLSRFARNFREAGRYLEEVFPRLGVRFLSLTDGYDSAHPRSGSESLTIPALNLLHEWYARDISRKVTASLARRRQEGDWLGRAPYGYRKTETHRLAPEEPAASAVRRVFRALLEGSTTGEIARAFNDEGLPAPALARALREGRPAPEGSGLWRHGTIRHLATNPVYVGDTVQGRVDASCFRNKRALRPEALWTVCRDTHLPLVSREEFQEVRLLLASRRRGGSFP